MIGKRFMHKFLTPFIVFRQCKEKTAFLWISENYTYTKMSFSLNIFAMKLYTIELLNKSDAKYDHTDISQINSGGN